MNIKKLLIVLVSVLILTGLFVYLKPLSKPEEQKEKAATTTSIETPAPAEALPADMFVSKEFGIRFIKPYETTETIKTIGNRIYVDRKDSANLEDVFSGQFVEVFTKSSQDSLATAIKKEFLDGYSQSNCKITLDNTIIKNPNYLSFEFATVDVVGDYNSIEELDMLSESCPPVYTQTNGFTYFMYDPEVPDKFAFVAVGQYLLRSRVGTDGSSFPWNETIEFVSTK